MNWREYFIVMKNAGLSWIGHLLPFSVVVAYTMRLTSSQVKFRDEMCQCSRFGNSGLFLVFSKEVQEKLYEDRKRHREWDKKQKETEEQEELERLNKKYSSSVQKTKRGEE